MAIVTSPDRVESWALPINGGIAPEAVQRIVDEMAAAGKLSRPLSVQEILRDGPVIEAFREVSDRPKLKSPLEIALAAERKYGF